MCWWSARRPRAVRHRVKMRATRLRPTSAACAAGGNEELSSRGTRNPLAGNPGISDAAGNRDSWITRKRAPVYLGMTKCNVVSRHMERQRLHNLTKTYHVGELDVPVLK